MARSARMVYTTLPSVCLQTGSHRLSTTNLLREAGVHAWRACLIQVRWWRIGLRGDTVSSWQRVLPCTRACPGTPLNLGTLTMVVLHTTGEESGRTRSRVRPILPLRLFHWPPQRQPSQNRRLHPATVVSAPPPSSVHAAQSGSPLRRASGRWVASP